MKRWLPHTIRAKITAITVTFTLVIMAALVSFCFYLIESFLQKQVLQSTEFNLQLVSGTVAQYANYLDTLGKWCSVNNDIVAYLKDTTGDTRLQITAFDELNAELRNNRASYYVQRLVIFDTGHTRMLQVGNIASNTEPVTIYNLDKLETGAVGTAKKSWQTVIKDPYDWEGSTYPTVVPVWQPIYNLPGTDVLGYVYMEVSTQVFVDPMQGYSLPSDASLYVMLGSDSYRVEKGSLWKQSSDNRLNGQSVSLKTLDAHTQVIRARQKDGGTVTLVQFAVSGFPVYIAQSLSHRQVAERTAIFQGMVLVICLGILLLGVGITLYLNRLITTPVTKMRRKIAAIAQGEFTPDPTIEWDNELGEVGRGINRLSHDVVALMESRLADEKKKQELEYRMLQSQINPHFIYNTLNSIKWMATIQGATGISEMTTALSRLLKTIAKGTRTIVPLRDELQFLDDYFLIQKYRFGGAMVMQTHVDEAVLNTAIPRFTLQPLMENAIVHGIEPKGGAGTITVTGGLTPQGDVEIRMEDDGVGMDEENVRRVLSEDRVTSSGMFQKIGIRNVHKRIRYEFGEPYGITVASRPGSFTRVSILLPARPCDPGPTEGT